MNILIKLTCLIGLVIAPILGGHANEEATAMLSGQADISKEIKVEKIKNDDGSVKATVTTISTENGKTETKYEVFEGSDEEVTEKLEGLDNVKVTLTENTIMVEKEIEEVMPEN